QKLRRPTFASSGPWPPWQPQRRLLFSDDASQRPGPRLRSSGPPDGSAAPLRGLIRGSARTTARDWAWRFRPWSRSPHQLLKLTLPGENLTCPGSLDGLLGLALRRKKWQLAGELLPGSPVRPAASLPGHHADPAAATGGPAAAVRRESGSCATTWQQFPDDGAALLMFELPFELAEALYSQAKQVFCTALQRLYRGAITEAHKGLVFNYLGGRFHGGDSSGRGPLFCPDVIRGDSDGSDGRCLFDLMLLTHEPELLALRLRHRLRRPAAGQPRTFCCHLCRDSHGDRRLEGPSCSSGPVRIISSLWPERGDRLRRRLPNGCTPQVSMLVCALFNAAFLCLLGFYVYEDVRSVKFVPGYKSMSFCKRLSWYLSYRWNLVDIAAMAFLLIGLIWIIVLDATTVSLFLAVSFIFYCMRMLSSLGYFERLGLYISITKTTIMMDVIPFLIVNAFFLASFGILIVCLLFPSGAHLRNNYENPTRSEMLSTGSYITEVFQRPLLAHFGEFGMDWLRQCQRESAQFWSGFCSSICSSISIVLINVLIAKLSLTVGKEDERARVIWRSFRAQLLAEFGGEISSTPPILLAIAWIATPEKAELGGADERSSAALPWWQVAHGNNRHGAERFPHEFLWFQSMQFRTVRQKSP
uniref:Ion_trans domain-containing protein n=1 Tax=Macrostomum lignano TaxID=282301 RepID=A0A1I8F883_9PLAT